MCLMEEIYMSDHHYSGMSNHAVGCGLSVKESTPRYLQKKEHVCQSVCKTALESAKVLSTVHDEATEKMEK